MQSRMFTASHHFQIIRMVIGRVFIYVMNHVIFGKRTANLVSRYRSVLQRIVAAFHPMRIASSNHPDVALAVGVFATFPHMMGLPTWMSEFDSGFVHKGRVTHMPAKSTHSALDRIAASKEFLATVLARSFVEVMSTLSHRCQLYFFFGERALKNVLPLVAKVFEAKAG